MPRGGQISTFKRHHVTVLHPYIHYHSYHFKETYPLQKIPSTSTQPPPFQYVSKHSAFVSANYPQFFKPTPTRPRRQVTGWRWDTSLLSLLFDTYHHQLHTSSSSPIKGWTTRVKLLLKGEMVFFWRVFLGTTTKSKDEGMPSILGYSRYARKSSNMLRT